MDNSNLSYWNRAAKKYAAVQEDGNKEMFDTLIKKLIPFLHKDMNVLELACGTGQLTFSLAPNVASWEATDFSPKMIEEAKKRSTQGINFAIQDATSLTYADHSFDAVVIANALHIMPNPDKALTEIHRVLKDDGIMIAPTFVYEGKRNKVLLFIMGIMGLKMFYKWKQTEYIDFIEQHGFSIINQFTIPSNLMPECVAVCRKK